MATRVKATRVASFHFEELKKLKEDVIKPDLKKWAIEYEKILVGGQISIDRIKNALVKGLKDDWWRQHCTEPKKLIKNLTSIELLKVKEDIFEELNEIKESLKNTEFSMHIGKDYVEIKHPKYNNPITFSPGKDLIKKLKEKILQLKD